MLRCSSESRKNTEGAHETSVSVSAKLLRSPNATCRAEVCAILADGVWTNRRKYKAGLREAPNCEACGDPNETIGHVLHECPAWATMRNHLRKYHDWFQQQKPATRCCLLCPQGASSQLCALWPRLQQEAAQIVHHRQLWVVGQGGVDDDNSLGRASDGLAHESVDQWGLRLPTFEETVPFPFRLAHHHERGPQPWQSSLQQWNRLNWFFSRVRMLPEDSACQVRCSVLELYVSYVLSNGDERYESQIGDAEKGGWLSTQLERFRIAVLSWQLRSHAPTLVAKKQTQEPFTDWHSRFHLPKMQLLSLACCPSFVVSCPTCHCQHSYSGLFVC